MKVPSVDGIKALLTERSFSEVAAPPTRLLPPAPQGQTGKIVLTLPDGGR